MHRAAEFVVISAFVLLAIAPVYADDPSKKIASEISQTENSLYNFWSLMRDHWANISDDARRLSFEDAYDARFHVSSAKTELEANRFNMSLEFALTAHYLAERSCYRIYADMTWRRIAAAQKAMDEVPPYIPKPPEALNLLEMAKKSYNDLYMSLVFQVKWPGFSNVEQYIRAMPQATHRMFYEEDGPAKLADKAREQTLRYISSQMKVAGSQLSDALSEMRSQFIVSIIGSYAMLTIGLVPVIDFAKTKIGQWIRSMQISWSGSLFHEQLLSRWLPIAPVSVASADTFLCLLILRFYQIVAKYQLGIENNGLLLIVVVMSLIMSIASMVSILLNHYGKKPRLTGFVSIFLLLLAVALQVYAALTIGILFMTDSIRSAFAGKI